ncbi:MAG: hypothetical protein LBB89_10020, partial [Treponema sp.]|nr:hypothetical protein [Treponema sp.]
MDNLAGNFIKDFSQKMPEFFEFYLQWWTLEKMLNNSFADVKGIDIAYWVLMQSFAQKQINQFADKLPEKG